MRLWAIFDLIKRFKRMMLFGERRGFVGKELPKSSFRKDGKCGKCFKYLLLFSSLYQFLFSYNFPFENGFITLSSYSVAVFCYNVDVFIPRFITRI